MGRTKTTTAYSWICRDQAERDRFLDLHRGLLAVNGRILVVLVAALAVGTAWLEQPLALVPAAIGIVAFGAVQRQYRRFRRPEVWVLWALLGGETMIVLALVSAEMATTAALALVAWPVAGIAGRFHSRCVAVGTGYGVALVALVLALHHDEIENGPMEFLLPLVALFAVATVATVHRDSDIRHRGSATVDTLTGLLNRAALNARVEEIAEQSKVMRAPVAVIVADLDRFKRVNDEHGHAAGDRVLHQVAHRLRGALRAYDLVYRLGGEEFVVVVLGQDAAGAAALAETLRASLAAEPVAGLPITASFGVAGTPAGEPFVWDDVFAAADAALYEAKAAGRDRVHLAPPPGAPAGRALSFGVPPT
jgi:diguanylate cyclase (GGDEF)-like protein